MQQKKNSSSTQRTLSRLYTITIYMHWNPAGRVTAAGIFFLIWVGPPPSELQYRALFPIHTRRFWLSHIYPLQHSPLADQTSVELASPFWIRAELCYWPASAHKVINNCDKSICESNSPSCLLFSVQWLRAVPPLSLKCFLLSPLHCPLLNG